MKQLLKKEAGHASDYPMRSTPLRGINEPIDLAIKDGNVRAMQRFVSDASWDDAKMISKYRSLVNDDLGHHDAALIFDESGFAKKVQVTLGVDRQYCSTIGKLETWRLKPNWALTTTRFENTGWHHQMLICMLAHFFLWHLKIRLGEKAPYITLSQLSILLKIIYH